MSAQLLEDLRIVLNHQLTQPGDLQGKATIDETMLKQAGFTDNTGLDILLQGYLMIQEALEISQVPNNFIDPVSDGMLKFSGQAFFLEPKHGTDPNSGTVPETVLKPLSLEFSINASDPKKADLLITSKPEDWTLQSSFPWLPDYPFNKLDLSGHTLFFANTPIDNHQGETFQVDLATGLNFAAKFRNDGPLGLLNKVISKDKLGEELVLSGTIDPTIISIPDGDEMVTHEGIVLHPDIQLSARFSENEVNLPWADLVFQGPEIVIQTVEGISEQSFWLTLQVKVLVGEKNLTLSTLILDNWHQITFGLTAADRSQAITGNEIILLLGGNGFREVIPGALQNVFEQVGLRGMSTTFNVSENKLPQFNGIELAIGTTSEWQLSSQFIIKDLVLNFTLYDLKAKPDRSNFSATLSFFPEAFKEDFIIQIEHQVSIKRTTITGKYDGSVSLADLWSAIRPKETSLPDNFAKIIFSDFGLELLKFETDYSYKFYGSASLFYPLEILDKQIESAFSIQVAIVGNTPQFLLIGGLSIGNAFFNFSLELSSGKQLMQASWYQQGEPLGINSIAGSLGFGDFNIPEDLDIALVSASFSYDFKQKEFILTAKSQNYGEVSISSVSIPGSAQKALIFFCHLNGKLSASALPLVGDELGDVVEFSELKFLLASAAFDSLQVQLPPESKESTTGPTIHLSNVKRGATFMSKLKLGNRTQELVVPIYHPDAKKQELLAENTLDPIPAQPANLGGSASVGKSIGPFNFNKFGVSFKEKRLTFELDASLITAGLKIHLNGLGLSVPATGDIKDLNVKGSLNGLAVAFSAGPLSISGGLVHQKKTDSLPEGYSGEMTVRLGRLAISALGSYAEEKGEPSLFVFALIDFPLGGPPFFFVTGGATGFGYNRDLIIPGIDGIREFPLIEAAFGNKDFKKGDLSNNLTQMQSVIQPKLGQNWFGLGVRFQSFRLVNGFALFTLSFGNQTEVNVLGLATASIPFATKKRPIVFIEMALLARFLPDKGLASVEGALTNRSYLFSEKSQLTGGFAFYLWFGGEHAGDFVLSFGGYNDLFTPPAHYPVPQRVGIHWQVTKQLSITGQSYFALTPSCIMAGGLLDCRWHSGPLMAWFFMQTDILIAWQPFHYDFRAAIEVGVSLDVNLLFVRTTLTVSIGASMHIWGPDFSGKVKIKVAFVSFTISFGAADQQKLEPISWDEFKQSCFPDVPAKDQPNKEKESNLLSVQVNEGLIKAISEDPDDLDWIVNGSDFSLEVSSLIPFKTADLGEHSLDPPVSTFGVGLVMVQPDDFTSNMNISVTKKGSKTSLTENELTLDVVEKNLPSALWIPREKVSLDDEDLLVKAPVGYTIKPVKTEPGSILEAPLANLLVTHGNALDEISYESPDVPTSDPFDQTQAMSEMEQSINSTMVNGVRKGILDSLMDSDYQLDTDVNVEALSKEADQYWLASPTLSLLGEEKS